MHTFYKGAPDVVALPESTAEVVAIVRLCRGERVPIVPRGSGTGLIGGAMAPLGGVMIGLNRMTRIVEIDLANRAATVQPGLINLWLTRAVQERRSEEHTSELQSRLHLVCRLLLEKKKKKKKL